MATFTQAQKQHQIEMWQKALEVCATGEEYSVGSRRLRMSDLAEIRATLDWLNTQSTVEDIRQGHGGPQFIMLTPGRGGRGRY